MSEPLLVIGGFIAFVLVLCAPILGVVTVLGHVTCASQARQMNVPYSYGLLQDCMVEVDGKWIGIDGYKIVKVQP